MQYAIKLSRNEKIFFMKALYSVFHRDNRINNTEQNVLNSLSHYLGVNENEFKYSVPPDEVAFFVNSISDVRARIYFMEIIKEVYKKESTGWPLIPPWGTDDDFKEIYSTIEGLIISRIKL